MEKCFDPSKDALTDKTALLNPKKCMKQFNRFQITRSEITSINGANNKFACKVNHLSDKEIEDVMVEDMGLTPITLSSAGITGTIVVAQSFMERKTLKKKSKKESSSKLRSTH